ncbi:MULTISPECIES: hypothetical protein [unclassified Pseudomonas]|uniref:hypothetical protein n=1 Tax=unclassified Pseudomonas TaxID=196821 RepID=UPI0002A2DD62|nr:MULTISPECIES: hypothetical protein [unclassified Pseudomonas]MBB1605619.1 hypothetical protein [Pseudomonas sp. UMC76]MBB1639688.1 hypothetical protein [Pseudomonas sp. UME83]NTX89723.1 hypothetical protein [Pseudomonas sp. UMA643]NTY22131.1 hypothetical protein [Pseudomonas sp. UMC3103]NTY32315.1 hypothetical protein [Pseudomonas sp. UMC3129]
MRSEKSKDTSGRALGALCVVNTQPRAAIRRTAPGLPADRRHPGAAPGRHLAQGDLTGRPLPRHALRALIPDLWHSANAA